MIHDSPLHGLVFRMVLVLAIRPLPCVAAVAMDSSYNSERQGVSGQGAQWVFGTDKFTAEDNVRIQTALNTALSWDQINSRPGGGGKKVSYLAGHTVFENANKVFGFAGWDSSILHLSVDYVEKSEDGRHWMASATAIVRIALANGCGHEDVGNAHLKDKDKGEVLQRVKKAAVTDAKKRALRLFGTQLGMSMSDKEGLKDAERTHKQNQKELKANQQRDAQMLLQQQQPQQQCQEQPHQQPHQQPQLQQQQPPQLRQPPPPLQSPQQRHPPQQQDPPPQPHLPQQRQQQQQQQRQQQRTKNPSGRPQTSQRGPQQQQRQSTSPSAPSISTMNNTSISNAAAAASRNSNSISKPMGNGGRDGVTSTRASPPHLRPASSDNAGGGSCGGSISGLASGLRESSPNKASRSIGGACGGGGGSGGSRSDSGGRRMLAVRIHRNNSPAFDYTVADAGGFDGIREAASSMQTGPAAPGLLLEEGASVTAALGEGARENGERSGVDDAGGDGGDEFAMSQEVDLAVFMEIDSAIDRHTTSLSLSAGSGGGVSDNVAAAAAAAAKVPTVTAAGRVVAGGERSGRDGVDGNGGIQRQQGRSINKRLRMDV